MKIFASGFAYRMDSLGLDGYAVDSDAVMAELEKRRARSSMTRFEYTLPEYETIINKYEEDFCFLKSFNKYCTKIFPGPRNIIPTGGMLESVFDNLVVRRNYEGLMPSTKILFTKWVMAHANATVNYIYGLNLPTIEEFITLEDGCINDVLDTLYGGHYDPEADRLFPIALHAKKRELGRELTDAEMIHVRLKFYVTSEDEMISYKERFVKEVRDEWESFMDHGMKELIA